MEKVAEDVKDVKSQKLSNEEEEKLGFILARLAKARDQQTVAHEEFDNLCLADWVQFNAEQANSYVKPRKNKTDTSVTTGSPRQKMKALVSHIMKMNLSANVLAHDYNDNEDVDLGRALSALIKKSNELETEDISGGNEEKLRLRIERLLEQGTVFIEEKWTPKTKLEKKILDYSKMDPKTGFEGLKWINKYSTQYKCESTLLDLTQVYLGNIKTYEINRQPYICTREIMDYDEAKMIYNDWVNWQYVLPGNASQNDEGNDTIPYRNFRLGELDQRQVEIIKYQDLSNREYQIIINGVMMLPVDFPFPWNWDGYSITKQVLDPFSDQFAYGKSLMAEVRFDSDLLDELLVMMIHKTKQSIKPPMANKTKKLLSPKIFDPGTLWSGVDPDKLQKIIDHQGVNQSEVAMFSTIRELIDSKTVNRTMQGQAMTGQTTATEIMEMQKQAQVSLGLTLLSVQLMEEKRSFLRLYNILENWTKPIDTTDIQGKINGVFRKIKVKGMNVNGKNSDMEIEFRAEDEDQKSKLDESYQLLYAEKFQNKPKKIVIYLDLLRKLKYKFYIKVNPSERDSDNLNKILFQEKMGQAMQFFGQDINLGYFKKNWAQVWGANFDEAFKTVGMQGMMEAAGKSGMKGTEQGNEMRGSMAEMKASPKQLMK